MKRVLHPFPLLLHSLLPFPVLTGTRLSPPYAEEEEEEREGTEEEEGEDVVIG